MNHAEVWVFLLGVEDENPGLMMMLMMIMIFWFLCVEIQGIFPKILTIIIFVIKMDLRQEG